MPRPVIVKGPYIFDGKPAWRVRCPACGEEGIIDEDQYHGRVSISCTEDDYDETHNLSQPQDGG